MCMGGSAIDLACCSVCVTCWHSKDCLRSRPFVPGFHLCICSRLCICVNRLLCEHILMTSACAYAPYKNAYRSCWDCDWNATISIWSAASSLKRPLTQAEILTLLCLHQTLKIGAATNSAMCSLVGCIGKLEHPDPKTDKADIIPDWWCHPCGALPVLCLSAALQSAAAGTHRHTHTCLWLWRYAFVTWVRILPFC